MDFRILEMEDVSNQEGSFGRYKLRIKYFQQDNKPYPKLRHHGFWLLHNCVAHPLLGLIPNDYTMAFHQLTSNWLNHNGSLNHYGVYRQILIGFEKRKAVRGELSLDWIKPEIKNTRTWRIHNCLAHVLIGLFPHPKTFKYHDDTAKEMNVEGWV